MSPTRAQRRGHLGTTGTARSEHGAVSDLADRGRRSWLGEAERDRGLPAGSSAERDFDDRRAADERAQRGPGVLARRRGEHAGVHRRSDQQSGALTRTAGGGRPLVSLYSVLVFPGLGGSHSGLVRPPAKRVGAVEAPRGFESLPLRRRTPCVATRAEGDRFHGAAPQTPGSAAETFIPPWIERDNHQFVSAPSSRRRCGPSVIWNGERRAASRSNSTPNPGRVGGSR